MFYFLNFCLLNDIFCTLQQEKIKLERKRQRNRLAASKCRKKKLERIAKLEDKVKQLKNENNELGNVLVKLRESVQSLKSQVYDHVQAGCPIVVSGLSFSWSLLTSLVLFWI